METDAAAAAEEPDLLPVRMLNEFVYCPRLFHFMHVEGRWEDNTYTLEGKLAHRRVDRRDHVLPDPGDARKPAQDDGDESPRITRSVALGSAILGITAKLDLVEALGDEAVPVDTKRGRVPSNEERSWEPERVQLMAQGLLLREHGYHSTEGVLYFAGSRTRVTIPFTQELEDRTRSAISDAVKGIREPGAPSTARRQPEMQRLLAERDLPA